MSYNLIAQQCIVTKCNIILLRTYMNLKCNSILCHFYSNEQNGIFKISLIPTSLELWRTCAFCRLDQWSYGSLLRRIKVPPLRLSYLGGLICLRLKICNRIRNQASLLSSLQTPGTSNLSKKIRWADRFAIGSSALSSSSVIYACETAGL